MSETDVEELNHLRDLCLFQEAQIGRLATLLKEEEQRSDSARAAVIAAAVQGFASRIDLTAAHTRLGVESIGELAVTIADAALAYREPKKGEPA